MKLTQEIIDLIEEYKGIGITHDKDQALKKHELKNEIFRLLLEVEG